MSDPKAVEIPLIKATNESLKGYGYLIDNYEESKIVMKQANTADCCRVFECYYVILSQPETGIIREGASEIALSFNISDAVASNESAILRTCSQNAYG